MHDLINIGQQIRKRHKVVDHPSDPWGAPQPAANIDFSADFARIRCQQFQPNIMESHHRPVIITAGHGDLKLAR